jgi:hypothetical protein
MTADIVGTLAVALALDEPEQLLRHLKIQAMERMDAVAPIDAYVAKKWAEVAEGIAAIELKLEAIKRAPV